MSLKTALLSSDDIEVNGKGILTISDVGNDLNSCSIKKDQHGEYKHYVLYISKGDANLIINWSKSNL